MLPWFGSVRSGILLVVLCFSGIAPVGWGAGAPPVIDLWPGLPPGESAAEKAEADITKPSENLVGGRRLIRLANVSKPTLTFYAAPGRAANSPTVLVFPGGAYHILALDLEGTEVCEWLNGIGVNAVLVKYRVPRPAGGPPHGRAIQDAQRAIGMVRQRASEWGLRADRVGAMGFSAGGHLVATLSASSAGARVYPAVDAADGLSCRPDFQLLIYPAYLAQKEAGDALAPEVAVTAATPKSFVVISQDDPVRVENALSYYSALQRFKVGGELHIYPAGGHGYGLRPTELPVTRWAERATDWLRQQGLIVGK